MVNFQKLDQEFIRLSDSFSSVPCKNRKKIRNHYCEPTDELGTKTGKEREISLIPTGKPVGVV